MVDINRLKKHWHELNSKGQGVTADVVMDAIREIEQSRRIIRHGIKSTKPPPRVEVNRDE
jgi:hypothetical protein